MRTMFWIAVWSVVCWEFREPAGGQELLPPEVPIANAIDHYVAAKQAKQDVQPAPLAGDEILLRRTSLDLIGRIPTTAEVESYLADAASDKRARMVERLLGSPAYVRHQANEFNTMLMHGNNGDLRGYLQTAFRENRSWDRMFREMLLGEEGDQEQKGAIQFVRARVVDLDKLTNETSVTFFGINVSCAQCHDHPLVPDWTQNHFYGMKSFFNRTFDNGGLIGEREYGLVQYQTPGGERRDARLMFLTGTVIDEPSMPDPDENSKKAEKNRLEELKKNKQPPPPPTFSRRAQLVEVALRDEAGSEVFARAIVNRLWQRLYGRGLVSPVDQMHPENTPSHPEFLAWLARDFRQHGFDLQRLMQGMVLSDAYARSSRWEGSTRPIDSLFAVGSVRPLSPMQYAASLRLAVANPDQFSADVSAADLEKRLEAIDAGARGWASQFEQPHDEFQVGVSEALLFSNNPRIERELLRDGNDTLLGKLQSMKDPSQVVRTAFWTVFNRTPETVELEACVQYLEQRQDRQPVAYRQLLWSLLTSSEFRFNY